MCVSCASELACTSHLSFQVDWASTEYCYSPIIQSRSTSAGYDLRSTAESSSDTIAHKGVFLIAAGMRYKGYCANLGRSIIVDPSKVGIGGFLLFPVSFRYIGTRSHLQLVVVNAE
jgi:nucleosome binding factor SPN SPT16 subunit